MNNNPKNKDNDIRKIFTTLVLVLTLMIFTTGATYAYFALSASVNNTISGTAATASLSFVDGSGNKITSIPYIAPTTTEYQSKPMVPQYSYNNGNVLQKAFNGTGGNKCVDGNGNVICKAYSFSIKNNSTATAVIKGQIKFNWDETLQDNKKKNLFTNLKWKLMDSSTQVTVAAENNGTVATNNTFVSFEENISLVNNATKQYNLIIWIEETGNEQNDYDYGTFYATIQFVNQTDNTGITSTITS